MAYYVVSYDQHRDKDYTPVWTQLRNWGARRILESVWFVTSSLTAVQIRDTIRSVTRNEDSVAVIEIKQGSNWAAIAAQEEGVQWLRQNIMA